MLHSVQHDKKNFFVVILSLLPMVVSGGFQEEQTAAVGRNMAAHELIRGLPRVFFKSLSFMAGLKDSTHFGEGSDPIWWSSLPIHQKK